MADKVANKVREVAGQDFDQAKVLAQDAFRSAAYLYPFKVRKCIMHVYPQPG